MKVPDRSNFDETTKQLTKIANQAVSRAQEDNRMRGIPNTFARKGILYYELSNGTITRERPKYPKPPKR